MLIEVKDLKVGDEIIIPSNSNLRYLKVLRQPMLKKGSAINWKNDGPLYKGVMCSCKREEISYTWQNRPFKRKEWVCTPDEHNVERYENLNYRAIWLIKREGE